jgi:prevent-host-death family protein
MPMTPKIKGSRPKTSLPASLDTSKTIEVGAGVFKNTCLALMDKVRDERVQVLITKHGAAVARLVPADVEVPTAFGFMRGTVVNQRDIVSPDFELWGDL